MNEPSKTEVIIRAEVGSKAWGLNLESPCSCTPIKFKGAIGHTDGCTSRSLSDRDEMGVCVEGLDLAVGFHDFEQYVYRDAVKRTGVKDAPSEAGDLDLTIYSLRKFLRLALKGNPTILTLLYVPQPLWVGGDSRGGRAAGIGP